MLYLHIYINMLYSFWTNYDDSVTEAYEIENAPACVGKSLARSVLQSSMNFEDDTQPVNDDQVMASVIERELNMDPTASSTTTTSSSSSSPVSPLAPLAPVAPAAASSPALPTTADQEQVMTKLNHLLASKTKKMEKIRGSYGKY
jgi:hypothetical protein